MYVTVVDLAVEGSSSAIAAATSALWAFVTEVSAFGENGSEDLYAVNIRPPPDPVPCCPLYVRHLALLF